MGNDLHSKKIDIKEEDIAEVINEEKNNLLFRYYRNFSSDKNDISKQNFSQLTKIYDEKILDDIYELFINKKNKLSFNRLRKFYTSFKNPKLKFFILSFIIFGNQNKIKKEEYMNNLIPFMVKDTLKFEIFMKEGFLKKIKEPNCKDMINKNLFIENSNNLCVKELSDFKFIEDIPSSSQIINKKLIDIKPFNYICDCLLEKNELKNNKNENLEQMRIPFNNDIESVINGHMNFKSFEKIMTDLRVNQKLINLVIQYLKKYTMKDYMNFDDFKYLISNIDYQVSDTDKKYFLFKMILSISNEKSSINKSKLYNILQIDNKDEIEEKRIILESDEDPLIKEEINSYIIYMDILAYLPYLRYGLKPVNNTHKKQLILHILNHKSINKYLYDNFDKNTSFYPINIDFCKSLIKSKENIPDEINNSLIAEEDPIFNLNSKKKEEFEDSNQIKNIKKESCEEINKKKKKISKKNIHNKNKNNKTKIGVIICGELFKKIYEFFEFDYIIELTKTIKYLPKSNKEEKYDLEINLNSLFKKEKGKDNTIVYMVDFYPVKTLFIPFTDLINYVEKIKEESKSTKDKEEKNKKEKEENQNNKNKIKTYYEELQHVKYMLEKGIINKSNYNEKLYLLDKKYENIINQDN